MVFINYWMRLTLLLLVLCAVHTNTKRTKKLETIKEDTPVAKKSATLTSSSTKASPQKAIIAIEIIDPNDNGTKDGKSRKRTIESALGYGYNSGYQNFFNVKPTPPKYQVYKYSQQDIPAYKSQLKHGSASGEGYDTGSYQSGHADHQSQKGHGGHLEVQGQQGHGSHGHSGPGQFEIQKSVQYDLGSTAPVYVPHKSQSNLQQYYQNGATLFSSLDQNGHLSSLSSQVPNSHGPMVPVIIFRVYTNQLTQSGGLHPNIPSSHPYSNLNNVDLQGLLAGYVQKNPEHQQQPQQETQYYHHQDDAAASHQPQQVYYQQGPSDHQAYDHRGLQTNENYPDDAHTKVIFHKGKGKSRGSKPRPSYKPTEIREPQAQGHDHSRPSPQKFKITIPENTYSKVEVQEHTYGAPESVQQQVEQHYAQYEPPQQQYYYQPQHYQQQDYQPSVQYQQVEQAQQAQHQQPEQPVQYDAKQYVQLATYASQEGQAQGNEQGHAQGHTQGHEQVYAQGHAQEAQPQQQQQQQHQQQAQEYYQQDVQYVQYEHQQQVPQAPQHQQHYEQQVNTGAVQFLHNGSEQPNDNQDYLLVKNSNDAGRDLHPKVYNYHPHVHRGTQKKKRERKTRVPLVLSPEIMESLKSKQH